ncbi:hypothetical protein Tco_0769973 [Tanacetum coccineum]|uniref:Integrase, catalytic region, zinc finger, CCHC-type, peptidase aspartic, catalytic n=1 Tax=Tanacetum coccineum TaxID=301880 RepID=A0ABQ4ZDT5_9ASTR
MIIAGADNRPPMLEKSMYDSWKSHVELYIENREYGIMILNYVLNGPLVWPSIVEENGTTMTKKYEELSVAEKLQADCDLKATNIVLQGLPPDVYAIVNHHKVSKEIWDRVKLLMQGTKLSLQEKESPHLSQPQISHSSVPPSHEYQSYMNHQTSPVPQNAYHSPPVSTQPMTEFPQLDSGLIVLVFTQGDDPIACLNKTMAFLSAVAALRTLARQCTQPKRPRNAAWFKGKAMLAEVQESSQILDEEQLAFLADPSIPDGSRKHQVETNKKKNDKISYVATWCFQKKDDRISQTPSSNMKNKVEVQLRRAYLSSNKKNRVNDPICDANVKHTMLNANSELICVKCKQCMFDANHDVCFLKFVNDVNVRSKSKSSKQSQQHNIWKPPGKVFTEVGYKWKPIITLVGNSCPLTKFTLANLVPPKETTSHSVETQKLEIKVYSRRPKQVKTIGSSKKAKIVENLRFLTTQNPIILEDPMLQMFHLLILLSMTSCPDCSLVSGLRIL